MSSRFLLTLLGLALAVPVSLPAGGDADEEESNRTSQADDAKKPYDPVKNILPFPVLKTYQALFPDHQIWQVSQTGKERDAEYELIIFHPQTTGARGQQIGRAHITTLLNYKLLLKGTGEVIREESHPIAQEAVPKVVRDAVDKWSRSLKGRSFFAEWEAHQEVGAERLFAIYIELTAIEAYRATLKADGTFVTGSRAFEKYRLKNP